MTISYNWLCDYLPDNLKVKPTPEQLSRMLTSVGLEVEGMTKYESIKGLLEGLVVGEVLTCEPHPNADKLKVTRVNIGGPETLQIVCGASNVAVGQKVVVATPGSTLHPETGPPFSIKATKIRSVESEGMLCAEDEIGLGKNHAGILVLAQNLRPGSPVADYLKPYSDHIYEIGLTPNHMDAMSHIGVARDICAYLSQQDKKEFRVKWPVLPHFTTDNRNPPIAVHIENRKACGRYSGVSIKGLSIQDSPQWMQNRLRSIGVRPINNVVDITNFVLHEMGQPLHAYDSSRIKGNQIIAKNLPAGTSFITLDGKERKLDAEDLMICDAEAPLCIAGVFGGLNSGITSSSSGLFLESAWFNPTGIRRTSFRHGLRTDAATHFEKGMDISGTVAALKRAAALIREYAGGQIDTDITDVYPEPYPRDQILLKYHYLKKLSGKNYHSEAVKNILLSLGFDILREGMDDLLVAAPHHKPDIQLPADVVEEIMRIDGYDNIEIPVSITISPSVETDRDGTALREKIAGYLTGSGFSEIFTNSITNSAYFSAAELDTAVHMINSLSAELNIMRPSLLETGLESIAWNINRKNNALRFFEFGKSYHTHQAGNYQEINHCCLYLTGSLQPDSWKGKSAAADFFYLKGICENILKLVNIQGTAVLMSHPKLSAGMEMIYGKYTLLQAGLVNNSLLARFDIRQPVYYADLNWDNLVLLSSQKPVLFTELPRQVPVSRDLALVVEKSLPFESVKKTLQGIGLEKLQQVQLFDIFESGKLGTDKKSLAVSFTFLDPEKTLTDKEIDGMMSRIMKAAEEELKAEIRK
ncbi:MAG: phenylalanine--tRNA ligase subunit beta [Bacteroidota bacterium]|nr:phenylalanine--tRNA ligase subunit beta [Bacteroidota bacterium]